ncbi:UNVERIFIED_CONTAM: hypothetical protein HHA_453860 [Hammondia hammondi]|eukprot:XP_008887219.1 hypothetical protein HHA_453860 [Hammondia hammondi]
MLGRFLRPMRSAPQVLGELVGVVSEASDTDESLPEYEAKGSDEAQVITEKIIAARQKVCSTVELQTHFSAEAVHSILRQWRTPRNVDRRKRTSLFSRDAQADCHSENGEGISDSHYEYQKPISPLAVQRQEEDRESHDDQDENINSFCWLRRRSLLLPAGGRFALHTRNNCNIIAFVHHFELPRYDTLEPLSIQQNCQLHTGSRFALVICYSVTWGPNFFVRAVLNSRGKFRFCIEAAPDELERRNWGQSRIRWQLRK